MKKLMKRLYHGSSFGGLLLSFPRKLYHFYVFHLSCYFVSDKRFVQKQFKKKFGHVPDLQNPNTLNEKIQWLKLYDRTPLHTLCADKFAVRKYVAEKIGSQFLVPLLYVTDNPDDIAPSRFPDAPFIVKTTHGSGSNAIVRY